jgi:methyl-accepting chemotaxis protein
MTQQVSYATAEQKRGGELVVKAMENISEIARDNLSTVEQMSKATQNLATQAENLAKLISIFRLQ